MYFGCSLFAAIVKAVVNSAIIAIVVAAIIVVVDVVVFFPRLQLPFVFPQLLSSFSLYPSHTNCNRSRSDSFAEQIYFGTTGHPDP